MQVAAPVKVGTVYKGNAEYRTVVVDRNGNPISDKTTVNTKLEQWIVERDNVRKSTKTRTKWRPPLAYRKTILLLSDIRGECSQTVNSSGRTTTISGDVPATNFNWNLKKILHGQSDMVMWDLNELARAETEVLVKLKNSNINLGEGLAEAKSTYEHLAKTTKTLTQTIRAVRHGDWKGALNALKVDPNRKWSTKDPAGRWLELQFGWTPLINDISALMDYKKTFDVWDAGKRRNYFSVTRALKSQDSGPYNTALSGFPANTSRGNIELGTTVKLYCTVANPKLALMNQIGLLAPQQVAWALMPWSFAIDWFLPIGTFLEAITAPLGFELVGGSRTRYAQGGGTLIAQAWRNSASSPQNGLFERNFEINAMRREPITSFPVPRPYIKSPFSTSHSISALALIRQLTKR